MRKYMIWCIVLIGLIGCGSNDKFKVTDDGNGTKSPRVSKVLIEEYDDGNLTSTDEHNYTYNEDNLLVMIESSYTETYTYNNNKQLVEMGYVNPPIHTNVNYTYSQTLFMENSKLPVLISRKTESYQMGYLSGVIRYYHYEINEEGKAVKLEKETSKSKDIYSSDYTEETDSVFYKYTPNGQLAQIIYPNSDYIESYTYTAFNKIASIHVYSGKIIYTYDKQKQLKSIEWYSKDENGVLKLNSKHQYIYENKPYYEAPSSLPKTE